jgi:OOP family OmpA-OmpF porin
MKKIAMAAVLSLATCGAFAQAYVGGGLGMSHFNVDCDGTSYCSKTDSAFKAYGGYKFTPLFGFEVSYLAIGQADVQSTNTQGHLAVTELKASAVTAALALRADWGSYVTGVLRVGLAGVLTNVDVSVTGHAAESRTDSSTKLAPYLGLGLELPVTPQLRGVLSADFTRGEFDGQTANVRLFGAGLQYGF